MKESFPHPYGTGHLEPYKGPLATGTAVWYIGGTDSELGYIPDGRRKGKDRPTLVRYSAQIEKNIGDHFLGLKLDDSGEMKWVSVFAFWESRRVQERQP